jgi:hypothetical protein
MEKDVSAQKLWIISLIIYEGLVDTKKAERLVETGDVKIEPNHNYGNVSGMCGATSASLPFFNTNGGLFYGVRS